MENRSAAGAARQPPDDSSDDHFDNCLVIQRRSDADQFGLVSFNMGSGADVGGGGAAAEGREDGWISSDDSVPWTSSKIASYNAMQKLFRCNECECIGFLSRIAEHWLGSHTNLRVFQCCQCQYASAWPTCVKMHLVRQHSDLCKSSDTISDEELQKLLKVSPLLEEVSNYLERLKSKLELGADGDSSTNAVAECSPPDAGDTSAAAPPASAGPTNDNFQLLAPATKRYTCPHCSYATDRKDLFTRHENIHREEKPFQCNICSKQFNRADHIKKHFARIHRDHEYVLSNVRRRPPRPQITNARAPVVSSPLVAEILEHQTSGSFLDSDSKSTSVDYTKNKLHSAEICARIELNNGDGEATVIASVTKTGSGGQEEHLPSCLNQSPPSRTEEIASDDILQPDTKDNHLELNFMTGTHSLFLNQADGTGTEDESPSMLPMENKCSSLTTSKMKKSGSRKNSSSTNCNQKSLAKCSHCSWTGADNWCLKRHLNTHIKPYTCPVCEYKAARSERLTTHIFRVHNKRLCTKCNFLTDNLDQLSSHKEQNHR